MKEHIYLSILILSIPERVNTFLPKLLKSLEPQVEGLPVEIIVLTDNKKRTTGRKRNDAIEIAQGEYVAFVDDDDRVSDKYVNKILNAIISNKPDVVTFNGMYSEPGRESKLVNYGLQNKYGQDENAYYRRPNHLMAHRRENAIKVKYNDVSIGEDDVWANHICEIIETEYKVDDVLYFYDYDPSK